VTTTPEPALVEDLEAQRDFLLRSLDDLETERAAGNLEDGEYERLKDDYPARPAAVLHALRDGIDARPSAPPVPRRRRVIVGLSIAGFAALAAVLVTTSLGARTPGGSLTGNAQTRDPVQSHLDNGQKLVQKGDYVRSFKEFGTAYKLDKSNPAAAAYTGWMVFQLREAGDQNEFITKALRLVEEAIALDQTFPDAHFFRGMILLQGKNDHAGADAEFQRFLEIVPTGPVADQVRTLLSTATTATTVPATTPTSSP